MKEKLRHFARQMKNHVRALYLAGRDPRTPIVTKCLVGFVVAYALSPIDLIPDFIPIIGYLDDALILPLGIYLAIKSLPNDVWHDCLMRAEQTPFQAPKNRWAAGVVIVIWLMIALGMGTTVGISSRTIRPEPFNVNVGSLRTATPLLLNRRAWHRTVRAIHTTITGFRFEHDATTFALIEPLAGIRRHGFDLLVATFWTGQLRL